MKRKKKKNPSLYKHALRAGDRVILTGKAHADEGRTATVVGPHSIKKTSRGVVDLQRGVFVPVDWSREIAVKVSGGEIDAWPKAWVRPVNANPRKRKRKNPTRRASTKNILAAWIRARSGRWPMNLSRAAMRRKSMKYLKKFSRTGRV